MSCNYWWSLQIRIYILSASAVSFDHYVSGIWTSRSTFHLYFFAFSFFLALLSIFSFFVSFTLTGMCRCRCSRHLSSIWRQLVESECLTISKLLLDFFLNFFAKHTHVACLFCFMGAYGSWKCPFWTRLHVSHISLAWGMLRMHQVLWRHLLLSIPIWLALCYSTTFFH